MWTILLFAFVCCFPAFCVLTDMTNTDPGPPDRIDISCVDGHTDKVVYRYPDTRPATRQPLQYKAQESVYGDLEQNMKIDGTGDCYDMFIRFRCVFSRLIISCLILCDGRGVNTGGWEEWKISKDKTFDINPGILSTPGFESLSFDMRNDSLCQNVLVSREIRYNQSRPNHCSHYVSYKVKMLTT